MHSYRKVKIITKLPNSNALSKNVLDLENECTGNRINQQQTGQNSAGDQANCKLKYKQCLDPIEDLHQK